MTADGIAALAFHALRDWANVAGYIPDKTLAIVEFLGADNVPIAVYMNYAMHPINFYLSGVISADFPGEASRYVEELFDNRTVAVFTQGASGDQNPRDFRSPTTFMGQRAALAQGRGPFDQTIGAVPGCRKRVSAGLQRAAGVGRAQRYSGRQASFQLIGSWLRSRAAPKVRSCPCSCPHALIRTVRRHHALAVSGSGCLRPGR